MLQPIKWNCFEMHLLYYCCTVDRDHSIQSKFQSFDLAVLPSDNNQFFVCTDLASSCI